MLGFKTQTFLLFPTITPCTRKNSEPKICINVSINVFLILKILIFRGNLNPAQCWFLNDHISKITITYTKVAFA